MLKLIKNSKSTHKPTYKQRMMANLAILYGETARCRRSLEALGITKELVSCDAWNGRVTTRIAAAGGGPLLVPSPDNLTLEELIGMFNGLAKLYAITANLARKALDPSAAWVCELNRAEMLETAFVLTEKLNHAKVNL